MDFIDRLRNKPLAVRKRIAFVASATATLAIFGLWATIWHFNLSQNSQKSADATAIAGATVSATSSDAIGNPFGVFVDVFSQGWQGLMTNISQINEGVKNVQNIVQTMANTASTSPANVPSSVETPASDSIKITQ